MRRLGEFLGRGVRPAQSAHPGPAEATGAQAQTGADAAHEELVRALRQSAWASNTVGNYGSATTLWLLAYGLDPSPFNKVNLLESARLSGCLPALPWFSSVTCEEIVEVLTSEFAVHLLAELASRRSLTAAECRFIQRVYDDIPRPLLAHMKRGSRGSTASILGELGTSEVAISGSSVWEVDGSARYEVLDEAYSCELPPLTVRNESGVTQARQMAEVRPGAVIGADEVTAWISSDLMTYRGRAVVDFYSWPTSELNSAVSDSRILSSSGDSLLIQPPRSSRSVSIDEGVWLAYPHTMTWGHWVRDVLCRLAYLTEVVDLSGVPVLVDSAVPARFQDLAKLLFGDLSFLPLESGTEVLAGRLWLSPSRVFATHNPRWHQYGMSMRINAEPQSFSRIRSAALGLVPKFDAELRASPKVYLSRENALQHRGLRDTTRLEVTLSKAGYLMVDPGHLTNLQQLSIFVGQKTFVGIDGSQWFLAALADPGTSAIIIGHDLSHDSRGRSWAIAESAERPPDWVLGVRDLPMPGYGEMIYHQSFSLPPNGWTVLEDLILQSGSA